ncbi:uncharacterized protein LOC144634690 [Oculina patagonica]
MKIAILFRVFVTGVLLLHYPYTATCNKFFFNATSQMQVSSSVIPLQSGFDFSFRTCSGGVLLDQKGTSNGFIRLEVVPTTVNYSVTPVLFIRSHLEMTWKINGIQDSVTLGRDLDRNIVHKVQFTAGSEGINSTLILTGLTTLSVDIPNSILGFVSSGTLFAGYSASGGGTGFVGCIISGRNIQLRKTLTSVNIKENCTLDNQLGCPAKVCPAGFTGDYCEVNIDDCAGALCDHYSTCIDLINNYSCSCGPRWTGRLCKIFLGSLCNKTVNNNTDVCLNGGVCHDTADKNNYTCTCVPGYTGRNCEVEFDPCDSSPCLQGGTCTKLTSDDFKCDCPTGFKGKRCDENIDDCAAFPCKHGSCIDGINNFTCNCTGSGYTGPTCDDDINECETIKPCHPNATCNNHRGTYQCICQPGFNGKNCYDNIDDCRSNPCQHGGKCKDEVSSYRCECVVGFNGTLCEHNIDDCVSHTCNNYSLCQDGINNYTCVCKPGFEGEDCSNNTNDCKNDSCVANATCIDGVNNFTCQCPPGYYGEFCHLEIDECQSNPCQNNGTCIDLIGGFNCTCVTGFNGTQCENNIDDCPSHRCNNGTCNDGINEYTCICNPGFNGTSCEIDIDECQGQSCNCGTCIDLPGSYKCICDQWTTGKNCEIDIDECSSGNHCSELLGPQGQGRCFNLNASSYTCLDPDRKGFECLCRNGFTGIYCQTNINDCKLNDQPCKNGATCVDGINDYTCTCMPGYTGQNCTVDIDECAFGFCQNNATCTESINNYTCTCVPGFTDFNCSTNINECEPNPCVQSANCTDLINDYNCTCLPGFTGKNCSVDIKECDSNPCQNNGTCVDLIADVNCTCTANYTGKFCELRRSSCNPNPCRNNATCTIQNNNFTCTCAAGFGGTLCDNITTVGFNGSSYMKFTLEKQTFELSFQLRTTLNHGLLAADSSNKFLVFLDNNNVHVLYNETQNFSAGRAANLSNGLWHTVHVNISRDSVSLMVDNSSCGQQCKESLSLQTQVFITNLYIGGSSFPSSHDQNLLYNFTGCIQDVMIDSEKVIPIAEAGVDLVNTVTGCPRSEVCVSNSCAHGKCVDEWIKFSCECTRPWIGPRCNTSLIPATFGATEPLNSASSRRRRDVESMRNASFAKFLTNGTSFGATGELSFFIRTRELSGLIILMTDNKTNYISVGIDEGVLVVRVTINGQNSNVTINGDISDGKWHFVEIQGNMSRVDNVSVFTEPIADKDINLTLTYIGGLDDFSLYPDANLIRTPFRGCLQDIRLNNKLFHFEINDGSLISIQRFQLLAHGGLGVGCKGMNVCRSLPCGDGGFCKDLWNKYECDCKPRYGGPDCALYGCSLVNLCPHNTTCLDVGQNYECIHPVTLNGSISSVKFNFTSNVNVSMDVSLRVRTRQSSTVLIEIYSNSNRNFKMELTNGRVKTSFALDGDSGFILSDDAVNDGQWHNVMFNITNNQSHVTVDGSSTFNSSRPSNGDITSLLLSTPVVVGGSVFKGCLDNMRIGGLLLPFVDYYNSTLNVSHVTPLKPHFNVNTTGVPLGCHSDDVCGPKPCVRGICGDVWNQFTCACPVGWAGPVCNLTANMTCAHSPCVNGTCYNVTGVDMATNQSQVSDVGFDMFQCNCTPGFEGKRCEHTTKECIPNPCQHGANCTELHLNYTCTCARGYTGRNCEINIDDCAANNCTNNSTCNDGIDSYDCSCLEGFNGTYCELDINECEVMEPHGPCNATGTDNCNNTFGGFECNCNQGYFGVLCEYDPTRSCEILDPCGDRGNCSDNETGYSCSCFEGYNGTQCENDIRECDAEPCQNNGTCIDSHVNSSYFPGYKCNCTVDYTGNQCEKKIDLCELEPCKNNATCERLAYNKYQCNCTPEYKGENCTIFQSCYSGPCKNGATCTETYQPVSNYTCTCALGFYGRNCENITDYCSPDPCRNNATCVNLNTQGKYFCNCTEGFGNVNCSGLLKYCSPDPCVNGNCIPLMDTFQCQCDPGYTGKTCAESINKCQPNPCQHNGTCTPSSNSFSCNCTTSWVGKTCQFENPCIKNQCENGATCQVNDQFGNFSCVCPQYFTGVMCETSLEPTDPDESKSETPAALIGGVTAACVLAILLFILLLVVVKKRESNGTYSPSKEEVEAGRVELDSMLKPPPQERLI